MPSTPSYDACQATDSKPERLEGDWSADDAQNARNILFFVQFLQQLAFAGTIVDSYQVAKFFGASPAFSGLLVGLFMTGGAVGTSCMMLVLQVRPTVWKNFRAIVLTCQTMDTVGVLLYTLLLYLGVNATGSAWIYALAVVRFAWGLGSGVTGQLAGVAITKMTAPHELPEQMQNLQFWQTLGLGLGPLMASISIFVHGLVLSNSHPAKLCCAPSTLAGFQLMALCTLWQVCPTRVHAWHSHGTAVSQKRQELSSKVQVFFLCSCFLLCALRGYAVAGAEVGTAMLLEVSYEWKRHSVGILVSGAFLASIPLRGAYFSIKDWFDIALWIRILSFIAIGGTTLLFSHISRLLPNGVMLVLADAIMFPSLYLGEGLTRGLMMRFAKDSTVISANHASFMAIVLNNVARTIAPWMSRQNISSGKPMEGQDLFAFGQVLCCTLFLLIFELGFEKVSAAARPVIVIGLPSLNEAHNIERLTKTVDEGGLISLLLSHFLICF